jgi:hypothetical protein
MSQPRSILPPLLATLFLAAAAPAETAETASADRFLWLQANARMATAAEPQEFAEAAALYRQLLDRGIRNAPLFHNYGTALLLAEAPEAALDAFLRAERRGGSSADLRRNLDVALAARHSGTDDAQAALRTESLPWTRTPLFWHYQMPLRHRLRIVLLLHGTLWLAVLLRLCRLRDTARGLAVASLAGLFLFGSSLLVSLHQDAAPLPDPDYRWQRAEEAAS